MRRHALPFLLPFAGSLAVVLALALAPAARPDVGSLQQGIAADRAREQQLQSAAGSTSALISRVGAQLQILTGRVDAIEAQLAAERARVQQLAAELVAERALAARLQARYLRDQARLGRWLVADYEHGRPDLISVVFESGGFSDLIERLDFLRRLSDEEGQITTATGNARQAALRSVTRLRRLGTAEQQAMRATAAETAALQSIQSALAQRQAVLDQAHAAEVQALQRTRGDRSHLQSHLRAELAALAAPPTTSTAPSGTSFAIPWAIVQCESGGQNLPPNSAGASGYYQIIPSTWKGEGGTGPAAYLAPKSEQDQIAAKLWNGGAGASNWVCAGIVGIH
jgi:septal ring factor EnvC (AmiA/AmiB activator)